MIERTIIFETHPDNKITLRVNKEVSDEYVIQIILAAMEKVSIDLNNLSTIILVVDKIVNFVYRR